VLAFGRRWQRCLNEKFPGRMEAAAVFTVAHQLGGKAAALFVISDHPDERGWEPRFHDRRPGLRRALDLALETFRA
jgi:purine-nucleoside phosphorylase